MGKIQEYPDLVDTFDNLSLDNVVSRRIGHITIIWLFSTVIERCWNKKCGLDDNDIKNTHLKLDGCMWDHV